MRKFAIASCAAALMLGACNSASTDVTIANNTLATLAKTSIPAACTIIGVAEGYYATIVGTPAPAVATAEAAAKVICDNPPTDLAGAFATLLQEWTIVQSGTVKPTPTPTPTPTP